LPLRQVGHSVNVEARNVKAVLIGTNSSGFQSKIPKLKSVSRERNIS